MRSDYYALVAAPSPVSRVSQGCRSCTPLTLPHPFLDPPVGCRGYLDLRNPVALQRVQLLSVQVSRYTLTLRCWAKEWPKHLRDHFSEAWGPPQFQEKRSRSEKPILGALGEFWGILGAALGIGNSILGIRNSILGMASHDLINAKPTFLGATLGTIPGIAANEPERFSFGPAFSERFFKNWGGPRAPE